MNPMNRLIQIAGKSQRKIIGLMSGMSMDGVDLAVIDISGTFPSISVRVTGTYYRPYSPDLRERLLAGRTGSVSEVSRLNVLVAEEFASCVNAFLAETSTDEGVIDAIGSHGQTLYHCTDGDIRSTLQVGCPSIIAEMTGMITVGNFRPRDVAAGGQGAPLVALADVALHPSSDGTVGYVNLGSIANVTVVSRDRSDVIAFDLGPANMPIDFAMSLDRNTGQAVDVDGAISRRGNPIEALLSELLKLPFFEKTPPRAAGYDEFGPSVLSAYFERFKGHSFHDLVRTAVEFSAQSISRGVKAYVLGPHPTLHKLVLSGGGVYNETLMVRIRALLPELEVTISESTYAKTKEAVAFAILAHETLNGRAGNIPSATGAKHAVVLGEIAL